MKRLLYIICLLLTMPLLAFGQQGVNNEHPEAPAKDAVVVSLLTCSPGNLVYELYGHTAIRVRNLNEATNDWVFNYGTFSFKQPHFMWRFVLGQTDYELGVVPYPLFYESYAREGRSINELVLNLTPTEAKRLEEALANNLVPENATYRYNFFYDNCVTRALHKIEEAVDGKVLWPKVEESKTLRNIVHEFSNRSPWNLFGQDLLLGAETDQPANINQQMFAPLYAEQFARKAMIVDRNGTKRHLVANEVSLLPAQPGVAKDEGGFPLLPITTFGILFAFTIGMGLIEYVKKKYYWLYDVLLFVAQGLTGCIVTFLFCFSTHPAVGSNWLVLLFNPLPLLLFPWYMKAASQRKRSWGAYFEMVMLVATLGVAVWGVQRFPTEVYFIMATLVLRLVAHFAYTKPTKK